MRSSNVVFCTLYILASVLGFAGCENMELNPEKVSVESVTLNSTSMEIEVGQSQTLTATISPSDADNRKVIWSTSNSSVATVADGVVTGVSAGSVTITAKSDDGGKTAICEVTVKAVAATVGPATLEMNRITATTASFDGHLNVSENEIPFSAVTLYYSDEETFSIGTAQSVSLTTFGPDQNFSFYLTDLRFDTEYSYSLVVKVKSEETYLDVKKFRTNVITSEIDEGKSNLSEAPINLTGVITGLSSEDMNSITIGLAYSQDKEAITSGTATEVQITDISASGVFDLVVENTIYRGDNYFSFYIIQRDNKTYFNETIINVPIEYYVNRLIQVSEIGYDSYNLKIIVPEEAISAGNHVHFFYSDLWRVCRSLDCSPNELSPDSVMKLLKSDCDYEYHYGSDTVTKETKNIVVNNELFEGYYVSPGEPVVVGAVEVSSTGEFIGNVEVVKFKMTQPDVLSADIKVEVSDISATDAQITITPKTETEKYYWVMLDDAEYNNILKYCNPSDLQWLLTSLSFNGYYGTRIQSGSTSCNLSDWWGPGTPNTKYHILITGKGDEVGTTQCFKHVEFETTSKKRTKAPVIEVAPVPEKSTCFSAAFNVRCTSYDDPSSGPVISCVSLANYVHEWLYQNDYSNLLSQSGTKFTSDQLAQINSEQGYTMHIPVIDGLELRFGVKGENDENDSSGAVTVDYATPYYKAETLTSDFLSTDILEGEWIMTATDFDGKTLETTVDIIRSLKEGRDYQSGCPSEFVEQVDVFNQKRLTDKNSLLIQGWFLDSKWGEKGPYAFRSPYDLLMANDYNAQTYQQLFFAAGPKFFMEVKPGGKLVIVSDAHRYMPVESWGLWLYLGGISDDKMAVFGNYSPATPSAIEFPVKVSEDNKTLTIEPADYGGTTYYLNVMRMGSGSISDAVVNSSIVLKKK